MLSHQKKLTIISGISLLVLATSTKAMDEQFQCKVPAHKAANIDSHSTANGEKNSFSDRVAHVAQDAALAYGIMMSVSFIHEVGHALAEIILYKNFRNTIHIGQPDGSKPLLNLGGIVINSLNPFRGAQVNSDISGITRSTSKDVIKSFAGPVCGFFWSYWQFKRLEKKYPTFFSKYPISKIVSLFMVGNNIRDLVPDTNKAGVPNDGMQIYNTYKSMKNRKKY